MYHSRHHTEKSSLKLEEAGIAETSDLNTLIAGIINFIKTSLGKEVR
ncbi:hypothetical protein ACFLUJ_05680 [Chloroflexota bacterium]